MRAFVVSEKGEKEDADKHFTDADTNSDKKIDMNGKTHFKEAEHFFLSSSKRSLYKKSYKPRGLISSKTVIEVQVHH